MPKKRVSEVLFEDDSLNESKLSVEEAKENAEKLRLHRGPCPALGIGFANKDFNTHPLSQYSSAKEAGSLSVRVLSVQDGEVLILTQKRNCGGWLEAYLAKDDDRLVGLVHSSFVTVVETTKG